MAAIAPWGLLDEKSESELHKTRLLNVEEKPFKRITKRLGPIASIITQAIRPQDEKNGSQLLSPSSSDSLKAELTLDFAAFDSSIARFQFLHNANQRERERYAADQQRILSECHSVRAENGRLRDQLEVARATLAQRKKFDELAEKITSNRLLRPREDQAINLAKLEDECRQLERESETYIETWRERREQFNRIMEEGMMLRRQIRDEKEEVDRREGMNEGGADDDADGEKDDQTPKILPSGHATPQAADGENQAKGDIAPGTSHPPSSGGGTPLTGTPGSDKAKGRLPPTASEANTSAMVDLKRHPQAQGARASSGPDTDVDMEDIARSTMQGSGEVNGGEVGEEGNTFIDQVDSSMELDQ